MLELERKYIDAWSWSRSLKLEFRLHSPGSNFSKLSDTGYASHCLKHFARVSNFLVFSPLREIASLSTLPRVKTRLRLAMSDERLFVFLYDERSPWKKSAKTSKVLLKKLLIALCEISDVSSCGFYVTLTCVASRKNNLIICGFVKWPWEYFFEKKCPAFKTCRKPSCITVNVVVKLLPLAANEAHFCLLPLHGAFCLWCRKGKAFICERRFALYRQQLKKDNQNVDVVPPGKNSADAHVCGFHDDAIDLPCDRLLSRVVIRGSTVLV